MSAEKLTRNRLFQILLMLTILVTAFVWRSVSYFNERVLCRSDDICLIPLAKTEIRLIPVQTRVGITNYTLNISPSIQILPLDNKTEINRISDRKMLTTLEDVMTLKIRTAGDSDFKIVMIRRENEN